MRYRLFGIRKQKRSAFWYLKTTEMGFARPVLSQSCQWHIQEQTISVIEFIRSCRKLAGNSLYNPIPTSHLLFVFSRAHSSYYDILCNWVRKEVPMTALRKKSEVSIQCMKSKMVWNGDAALEVGGEGTVWRFLAEGDGCLGIQQQAI